MPDEKRKRKARRPKASKWRKKLQGVVISIVLTALTQIPRLIRSYKWPKPSIPPITVRKDSLSKPRSIVRSDAYIQLNNNAKLFLEDIPVDSIVQVDGCIIKRADERYIVYLDFDHSSTNGNPDLPILHTFYVPTQDRWQVQVPGGILAYVNTATYLSYPIQLSSSEIKLQVQGEAYFEVPKNASRPVRVNVGSCTVDVLGTSFDVRHYWSRAETQVTLVTGSVKVHYFGGMALLHPQDQACAILSAQKKSFTVHKIDTASMLGWLKGYFDCNKKDIRDILQEMVDYYGLKAYLVDGNLPAKHCVYVGVGAIPRELPLETVLQQLSTGYMELRREKNYIVLKTNP